MNAEDLMLMFSAIPTWLVVCVCLLLGTYTYLTWTYSTFTHLGFPYEKPQLLFGTMLPLFKKGVCDVDMENRKKYGRKAYGFFMGRDPWLMVGDPEELKQFCIKNFTSAPDRWLGEHQGLRGPMKTSVGDVVGDRWENQRRILTPTYTGSKLRQMTPWIVDCSDRLTAKLRCFADDDKSFEMGHLAGCLAMDVIAGTGFGLDTDSLTNPDNSFAKTTREMFALTMKSPALLILLFLRFLIPLCEALNISLSKKWTLDYYKALVGRAIRERRNPETEDAEPRTDLLQMMVNRLVVTPSADMQKHADNLGDWYEKAMTEDEIIGNSMLMLFAAYHTTANTISFLTYNIATHPHVQDRLLEEVDSVLQGELPTYDSVQRLQYLEQCVNETLRMYPSASRTDRVVVKPVEVEGKVLPPGMIVAVPIHAIHHDPEYWPEPEKFDPDRFAPGHPPYKDELKFMPFGVGRRMCIGNRLAMLEMKMCVARILQTLRLCTCEETEIPLTLVPGPGLLQPKNGIHLKAELRKKGRP